MSTWFITGCSTGLGRHFAQTVLERGHNAVITARNPEKIDDLVATYPNTALALALDVTNKQQVQETVQAAQVRFGAIDVLLNNAGYGYRAAIEEGEDSDVARLFATNVSGPVNMIKATLPGMRSRRSGTIVNISSVAPWLSMPGSGYYNATKAALNSLSDTLRNEVAPLGIKVLVVEPGAFRTDFVGRSLHGSSIVIEDYAETVGPRRKGNDTTSGKQPGDPAKAANLLVDLVQRGDIPDHLLLGSDAYTWAHRVIEDEISKMQKWKDVSASTDFS